MFPHYVNPKNPNEDGVLNKSEGFVCFKGKNFPVVRGIPRFVGSENYTKNFGDQWNLYRDVQLDSKNGHSFSERRLRSIFGVEDLSFLKGKLVLEAGCGAGRFTEILLKYGAYVDAFDLSNAVDANLENNNCDRLRVTQANILQAPFPLDAYDIVLCIGVLQHTPSTSKSLSFIFSRLKVGGLLAVDHYRWKLKSLPPPLGYAGNVYRLIILRLPYKFQARVTRALVNFFFPLHWLLRDYRLAQECLFRISPVRFYYPWLGLKSKREYELWAHLDTHDGCTDIYHRRLFLCSFRKMLLRIGATIIRVRKGGNGIEALVSK